MLAIGKRVKCHFAFEDGMQRYGSIYDYQPRRRWPWHVLTDDGLKVAFTSEELSEESVIEAVGGQPRQRDYRYTDDPTYGQFHL